MKIHLNTNKRIKQIRSLTNGQKLSKEQIAPGQMEVQGRHSVVLKYSGEKTFEQLCESLQVH